MTAEEHIPETEGTPESKKQKQERITGVIFRGNKFINALYTGTYPKIEDIEPLNNFKTIAEKLLEELINDRNAGIKIYRLNGSIKALKNIITKIAKALERVETRVPEKTPASMRPPTVEELARREPVNSTARIVTTQPPEAREDSE